VAMYVRAYRAEPDARVLARRFGTAFAVGAVLWLVSIFTPPPVRFVLWAAAVAADLLGRAAAGGTRATVRALPPDTAHMAERYATFTLIVLGESFIKIVDGIVEQGPSAASQVFAALGFLIVVALWWTYFDDVAGARIRDWQQRLGPGAAWIYSHLPLTLALTGFGVGVQHLALLSFGEDIPAGDLWLLAGSMAVALAALALLDWATESPDPAITERDRVLPRLVAAGAVLVVAALGGKLPALLEASLLALVALAQMAYEVVAGRRERSLTAPGRGSGSGTAPGPPRPG
jgi:low temperature requirement protein LtrA